MSEHRRRAKLRDIQNVAQSLREPIEVPDFTTSILDRVHEERPFIAAPTRRWIPVARIGSACAAVLVVFGLTLIIFIKPDLPEKMGGKPSVATDVFESAEFGLAEKVQDIRSGVAALQKATTSNLAPIFAARPVDPSTPVILTVSAPATTAPAPLTLSTTNAPPPSAASAPFVVTLAPPITARAGDMPIGVLSPMASIDDYSGRLVASSADFSMGGWTGPFRAGSPQGAISAFQRGAALPIFLPPPTPQLNRGSRLLVEDLTPFITGQPVGDDLNPR